jgi:hypothetical protein
MLAAAGGALCTRISGDSSVWASSALAKFDRDTAKANVTNQAVNWSFFMASFLTRHINPQDRRKSLPLLRDCSEQSRT